MPGKGSKTSSWRSHLQYASRYPQVPFRRNAAFKAMDKYYKTRSKIDLEDAIQLTRDNYEFLPIHESFWADLGQSLVDRYSADGSFADFEEAEQLLQRVLTSDCEKRTRTPCSYRISDLYRARAERTGEDSYAVKALETAKAAVEECKLSGYLCNCYEALSLAHYLFFMRTKDTDHLEEAIRATRNAIKTDEFEDPNLHDVLLTRLKDYYEKVGELHILEEAISLTNKAITHTSLDGEQLALKLFKLSGFLYDWHKKTGAPGFLSNAHKIHEQAVQAAHELIDSSSRQDEQYVAMLMKFARTTNEWFQRTEDPRDLAETIRLTRLAIDLTPSDSTALVERLMRLARYLSRWSENVGTVSQLKDAINVARRVIDVAPDDFFSEQRPISLFIHYLQIYYLHTHDMEYLEQSISLARRAVDIRPDENPNLGNILHDLVNGLTWRYDHTRALGELKDIVKITKSLVDMTPDDHPYRVDRLHLHVYKLLMISDRQSTEALRTETIQTARLAVEIAQRNKKDVTISFRALNDVLVESFRHSKNRKHLDESIEAGRKSVSYATDELDQANAFSSLSNALYMQYQKTHSLDSINETIDVIRRAIELYPPSRSDDFFDKAKLATYLLERERYTRTGEDLQEAMKLLNLIRTSERKPFSLVELSSGRQLITIYDQQDDMQGAFDISTRLIDLVTTMMPNSLENSDKQAVLKPLLGMASFAAYSALRLEKPPYAALDALERGRGVLGTSLEDMRRTDILDLESSNPELLERFLDLKKQLEKKPVSKTVVSDSQQQPEGSSSSALESQGFGGQAANDGRYRAGTEFSRVVEDIGKIPGFESFFSPPSEEDIRNAAVHGPLVVINENHRGYDAIIIEHDQIRSIPLPLLRFKDVKRKLRQERLGRPSVLEWLWDTTMEPILQALGYTQPVTDNNCWPHVWWIPTGLLSKLPLHAAGYHSDAAGRTVLDRVISSYNSSVKSIIYGRRRRRHRRNNQPDSSEESMGNALLVAMENTPRYARLPYATKEIRQLKSLCRSMNLTVQTPKRNKDLLMEHVQNCNVFHFAGHGHTDRKDPAQSYICLRDGVISVADLLELDLYSRYPFLAYLSACGTGQLKDEYMIDESLHLISSCQLAGFRHVVGTLWEVNDEICLDVAKSVYQGMKDGDMSDDSVARGMHNANRLLRDRWVSKVTKTKNAEVRGGSIDGGEKNPFELSLDNLAINNDDDDASIVEYSSEDDNTEKDTTEEEIIEQEAETNDVNRGHMRDVDDVSDDEDDMLTPLWVPYIHFGI